MAGRDVNGYTVPLICTTGSVPDNIQYLHSTQPIQDEDESEAEIEYSDEEMSGSDDGLLMDEF